MVYYILLLESEAVESETNELETDESETENLLVSFWFEVQNKK